MKKISVLLLAGLLLSACSTGVEETPEPTTTDNANAAIMNIVRYDATLADVTGGDASGAATVIVDAGQYNVIATFENLPELEEGFFYEGWVVREEPLSVVSTGALTNDTGAWLNVYQPTEDYSDHLKYVLTLEPDDGDPAPADHVLSGIFELTEI